MTKKEIFAKLQTEITIRGLSPGTYYIFVDIKRKTAMNFLMTVGNMAIFGCERSLSCQGLEHVLIRQQFDGWR